MSTPTGVIVAVPQIEVSKGTAGLISYSTASWKASRGRSWEWR